MLIGCELSSDETPADTTAEIPTGTTNDVVVVEGLVTVPTFTVNLADIEGSTWDSPCELLLPPLVSSLPSRFQNIIYRKEHISIAGNSVTKTRTYYSDDACLLSADLESYVDYPDGYYYLAPYQQLRNIDLLNIYSKGLDAYVHLHDLLEMVYPFSTVEVNNNVITQSGLPATEITFIDAAGSIFKRDIVSTTEDKQTLYFGQYADEFFFNCLLTNGYEPANTAEVFKAFSDMNNYLGISFSNEEANIVSILFESNTLNTLGVDGKIILDGTLKLNIDSIKQYQLVGDFTVNGITVLREEVRSIEIEVVEEVGFNWDYITYTLESGETILEIVDAAEFKRPYFTSDHYNLLDTTQIPAQYLVSIGGATVAILNVAEVRSLSIGVTTLVLTTGEKIYLDSLALFANDFALLDSDSVMSETYFECARPVDLDYSRPWILNTGE